MEVVLTSMLAVGIAELGDKTQLLVLLLARRFQRPVLVAGGMVVAFAVSHALAAVFGSWVETVVPDAALQWIVGGLFIAIGLWTLLERDLQAPAREPSPYAATSVFVSVFLIFMLAELGDKSQLTTVGVSMALPDWWRVAIGATLGGALVNLPVIWVGHRIQSDRFERVFQRVAGGLFLLIGLFVIFRG